MNSPPMSHEMDAMRYGTMGGPLGDSPHFAAGVKSCGSMISALTLTLLEIETGWLASLNVCGDTSMAAFQTQKECFSWAEKRLEGEE